RRNLVEAFGVVAVLKSMTCMSKRIQALFAITLFAVLSLFGAAEAAEWRVARLSGSVFIDSGPTHRLALTRGMVLQGGLVLVADKTGRALLIRADDQLIVSPNTTVAIPVDRDGIADALQGLGESELPDNRH